MNLPEFGTPESALCLSVAALLISIANGIYAIVITRRINKLAKMVEEMKGEE